MTSPHPNLSLDEVTVVIPTLNAAATLAQTLASVPHGPDVVVSDGGSTDGTVGLARAAGARIVEGPRGRGRQLAAGARGAARPWLLFLHADTRMTTRGWAAVAARVADPGAVDRAAVFHLRIDDPAWQARVIERGVALRVCLLALPYGDQGLLIHRSLHEAVGGYSAMPLMEDVDLARRLGRARLALLPEPVLTSARRWRRRGWVRQTLLNAACLSLYRLGVPIDRIERLYGR